MKKTALFLSLAGALSAQGAFAQSTSTQSASPQNQACSTEALMAANQNLYDQFEAYTANRMDQGQSVEEITASMDEITEAGNATEVLARHQEELEMMEPGSTHQPSQALCDDMYTMLDQMQVALDARQ
ncbi:hypothetical protein ACGK9R_15125 [Halomonas sp. HNIBRBA4712]|uniref:hypothetical protein n=1 Tax=Halomonas sp. HNIBRBA4712 TaxID=3373087 RepID=UPI0037461217